MSKLSNTSHSRVGDDQLGNGSWNERIDPLYHFLKMVGFAPFLQPSGHASAYSPTIIEIAEIKFLFANLKKHRLIMWLNVAAIGALVASGILNLGTQAISAFLIGLVGPVVASGVAWYTISFTGVPEKFIGNSMFVTGMLFTAVSLSLTASFTLMAALLPWSVSMVVLAPIYLALYFSAVIYDNFDGLKAAAGQSLSITSRAVQQYVALHDSGSIEDVGDGRKKGLADSESTPQSRLVEHLCSMLEANMGALQADQSPAIANHLVADSLDLLIRLLRLTKRPIEVDSAYEELISHATEMEVDEVNEGISLYLRIVAERLHALIGEEVVGEIADISSRLGIIDRLRTDPDSNSPGAVDGVQGRQELADFLFIHVFRALISIATTHSSRLIRSEAPK
ncbi:MAG: hypothetical protein K0U98_08815 [Deltaproteobacteria bacterium]|nr:hypothetical protein [Deltaproteobacteria bacterium]